MDSTAQLHYFSNALHTILVTRYTVGSALALLFWDIVITFDHEVRYIWPLPFGPLKLFFFFVRYWNLALLIYANHIWSGIRHPGSTTECEVFEIIYDFSILLYSFIYSAFVALRLYTIWDHRPGVRKILCVALPVVYIPVFTFGIQSIVSFAKNTVFSQTPLNVCVITREPLQIKLTFGCVLIYDVFVVMLAIYNALDRPRGPQHKIVHDLHRDGIIWFFIFFAVRLANFLFFIFFPASRVPFFLFITWSMTSLMVARMVLRIEATKRPFVNVRSRPVQVKTWQPARNTFELEERSWANGNVSVNDTRV